MWLFILKDSGKVDHNISLQHETVSPKKSYYSEILNNWCSAVFQICAEQAHNNVHCRFDLTHLYLFVQDFLQPHLKSS